MQILQPLAVGDIGLAARHMLYVAGVDETDFEPPILENLEERDPVHARRLHGDGANATPCEPIGQRVQILREHLKLPDRCGVTVGGHSDVDEPGADVDARRVGTNRCWT